MKKKMLMIFVFWVVVVGVTYLSVWSLMVSFSAKPIDTVIQKINDFTEITPQQIEADKIVILEKVQTMSKLETVTNDFEQVFRSQRDDKRWFGWCAEYMTFVANGKVVAGLDLSKIDKSDIKITDSDIFISLPKSEIFYSFLNEESSYPQSHTSGIFCNRDPKTESSIRKEATARFKEYALENNILEDAYLKATDTLKNLIINLEDQKQTNIIYKNITFAQK